VLALALLEGAVLAWAGPAGAVEQLPRQLKGIDVSEKLGQRAVIDGTFTDHTGKSVHLRDYMADGMPVLLTLNYYRCTTLCNIQLNALIRALRGMEWAPGENYRIVTVSINHREDHELAAAKRAKYLASLDRGNVDWSFLVGSEKEIKALASSVGFGFRYDEETDQYAHPAVLMFLSPEGEITRYIYGLEFNSRDLKFAIIDASKGKVGSTIDRVILSCFHYDASTGRYGPYAFGIMRLGGVVTLLVLGVVLGLMWRRERRRGAGKGGSQAPPPQGGDAANSEETT
jgi:protein SCO1/2